MKKAFKLFGFIALSMTLAVACGNANNTPAEEEVVAEETVEATEQVVEEVAAPVAQPQATCDEKKDAVKEMTKEDIDTYLNLDKPFDKAGAYAIQSTFAKFIDEIEGNYMSVIGLPIDKVYKILKENEII